MEGKIYNLKEQRLHITAESALSLKAEAHAITMHLIEDEVTTDYMKEKIRHITPEQYEDVVTERALSEICGYPLCHVNLKPQYASQTHIIRHNNVYDVTQRKNFCSDICYEASNIIANQVPKVPLYLRKTDKQMRNFELYIPDRSSLQGRYGRLVNIKGFVDDNDESIASPKHKTIDSVSDFKEKNKNISVDRKNMEDAYNSNTKDIKKPYHTLPSVATKKGLNIVEDKNCKSESITKQVKCKINERKIQNKISLEKVSIQDDKNKSMTEDNKVPDTNSTHLDLLLEVEQQMRQWMTFESLKLILGDQYVRGMLEELGKTWEDYDSTAGLCLSLESKSKYIALCKKLDLMEIEKEICEENESSANEPNIALKPVPNFDQLKKDIDEQSIKVKAFFEGKEEFATTMQDNSLETISEENEVVSKSDTAIKGNDGRTKPTRRKLKEKLKEEQDVEFVSLPLIDTYTQNTWRRIIVLEKISKPIAWFSCEFGLDEGQVRNLLKPLVASFDFTARNIIFRVTQWDYVALVLLKMLSVRYQIINEAMRSEKGCKVITALLLKFNLDIYYLDRLLTYLTEIVYILSKYHKNENCSVNNECSDISTDSPNMTMAKKSSSDMNFDEKTLECLGNASETANSSHLSNTEVESENLKNSSSEIFNGSNLKTVTDSLSLLKFGSKKSINTNTESYSEVLDCHESKSTSVYKIRKNKDYTDVREIASKTDCLNLGENMSTNMEELD